MLTYIDGSYHILVPCPREEPGFQSLFKGQQGWGSLSDAKYAVPQGRRSIAGVEVIFPRLFHKMILFNRKIPENASLV